MFKVGFLKRLGMVNILPVVDKVLINLSLKKLSVIDEPVASPSRAWTELDCWYV